MGDDYVSGYAAALPVLRLAPAEEIRRQSSGQVTAARLLDCENRSYQPGGLFCQRIFGALRDWRCGCGRLSGGEHAGAVCEDCGVQVTASSVRRQRFGHIELAAPVLHPWYHGRTLPVVERLLGLTTRELRAVLSGEQCLVDTADRGLQILAVQQVEANRSQRGDETKLFAGAAGIRELLREMDLGDALQQLDEELEDCTPAGRKQLERDRRLLRMLKHSGVHAADFVLEAIPVVPAGVRRLKLRRDETLVADRLTRRYQAILRINAKLGSQAAAAFPHALNSCEFSYREWLARRLAREVRRLFDQLLAWPYRRPAAIQAPRHRRRPRHRDSGRYVRPEFKEPKPPTVEQPWPGKRVDYSARSVVVPNPTLEPGQCGLPRAMAEVLCEPLLARRLCELGFQPADARALAACRHEAGTSLLDEVVAGKHVVLSFRSPRRAVLALEAVSVSGKALQVHPSLAVQLGVALDGLEAAVHLPLSPAAQQEAQRMRRLQAQRPDFAGGMSDLPAPSREALLGCHLATSDPPAVVPEEDQPRIASPEEAEMACERGVFTLQTPARFRLRYLKEVQREPDAANPDSPRNEWVHTTLGRILVNELLPEELPFYDLPLGEAACKEILPQVQRVAGSAAAERVCERLTAFGLRIVTRLGLSLGRDDLAPPSDKREILRDAWERTQRSARMFHRGVLSSMEHRNLVLEIWTRARADSLKRLHEITHPSGDPFRPLGWLLKATLKMPAADQTALLAMVGLITAPDGRIRFAVEPASYAEGLSSAGYFMQTIVRRRAHLEAAFRRRRGKRLTRCLAGALRDVVVTMDDCGTERGRTLEVENLAEREQAAGHRGVVGRVSLQDVNHPLLDTPVTTSECVSFDAARMLGGVSLQELRVPSPLYCQAPEGVCRKCYGADAMTGEPVEPGTAVGARAALAVGAVLPLLDRKPRRIVRALPRLPSASGEVEAHCAGRVSFAGLKAAVAPDGRRVVVSRGGTVQLVDSQGRLLQSTAVPHGAELPVAAGAAVDPHTQIAAWNPYRGELFASTRGTLRIEHARVGENFQLDYDGDGRPCWHVSADGGAPPVLKIENEHGETAAYQFLVPGCRVTATAGMRVDIGTPLAHVPPPAASFESTLSVGLDGLEDLLHVRRPADAAVLAEATGRLELKLGDDGETRAVIQPYDAQGRPLEGTAVEQPLRSLADLCVPQFGEVQAGQPITFGDVALQDVLRTQGEDAVIELWLERAAAVFDAHDLVIDRRHLELVLAQMLRLSRVVSPGESDLAPGQLVDRRVLHRIHEQTDGKASGDLTDRRAAVIAEPLLLGLKEVAAALGSVLASGGFAPAQQALAQGAMEGRVDDPRGVSARAIRGTPMAAESR